MESEGGMKKGHREDELEEEREEDDGVEEEAAAAAAADGVEEEEEDEGEDEDEDDDGDEDEDECGVRLEGEIDPLDYVVKERPPATGVGAGAGTSTSTSSEVQLYQHFQRLESRAQQAHSSSNNNNKNMLTEMEIVDAAAAAAGVSHEEMREIYNYTCPAKRRRRSSYKPKKRGRRKGSRNKLSPHITKMLGDAHLHYAHARYHQAISLLIEVIRLAPNLPDPYETLARVYRNMGDETKSVDCYLIAAFLGPKHSSLWKSLLTHSLKLKDLGQAWYCVNKAIAADPADVSLHYERANIATQAGDYSSAAESYHHIAHLCPRNAQPLKTAAILYKQSGQFERSITILEDYLTKHTSEADLSVVDMLASSLMETGLYTKALQHIEFTKTLCGLVKDFPLCLAIREGICHTHLGNMDKAEICFSLLQKENAENQMDFIMEVANTFSNLHQNESALKYYLMLEGCSSKKELISLKVAQCYLALKKATSAIHYFYEALQAHEDDIDARLALASLLLKENREDEAIKLLLPPPNTDVSKSMHANKVEPWWLNVRVKLKLTHIYRTRGMFEAFVEVIYPIVHESLKINSMHQKAKQRKRLSKSELSERVKVLGDPQSDSVFGKFRRPASKNDLMKANRAKKLIEKRASSKEEKISAAVAAGLDWESDDSEDEAPQQPLKDSPLPDLFKHEEHYDLISDLCVALTSSRRYSDALELIKLTLKMTYKTLPAEQKEKFQSLGAQIAQNVTDPSDGFDYVRYIVQQRPQSTAAWNCYYRLVLRLENRLSKHNKFLHHMRVEQKDLVPPMIISGNQFTMISQHQVAAREYLEAYKQMPDSPLVNLCAGTALVNLALGHRLQNKHQCLAQGLAFLYNNLRLCENNQEALYNIARAYHHVGLVSLAATYYEKVLAIPQEDCPLPKLIKVDKDPKSGHCDLRREAAYNLHLIYKRSGAVDLARQILRDYCTL